MKKLLKLSILLVACIVLSSYTDIAKEEKVLVATFKGIDDSGKYMFEDEKKNIVLFDVVGEEVEIDLEDEIYLDVKFSVTWDEIEDEIEEEVQEEKAKIKRILKLVEIE